MIPLVVGPSLWQVDEVSQTAGQHSMNSPPGSVCPLADNIPSHECTRSPLSSPPKPMISDDPAGSDPVSIVSPLLRCSVGGGGGGGGGTRHGALCRVSRRTARESRQGQLTGAGRAAVTAPLPVGIVRRHKAPCYDPARRVRRSGRHYVAPLPCSRRRAARLPVSAGDRQVARH